MRFIALTTRCPSSPSGTGAPSRCALLSAQCLGRGFCDGRALNRRNPLRQCMSSTSVSAWARKPHGSAATASEVTSRPRERVTNLSVPPNSRSEAHTRRFELSKEQKNDRETPSHSLATVAVHGDIRRRPLRFENYQKEALAQRSAELLIRGGFDLEANDDSRPGH